MLAMLAKTRSNVGVVLCNRGLYVEQAEALRQRILAPGQELVFVVGFDKIQQIVDPRYYADRDASLNRLLPWRGSWWQNGTRTAPKLSTPCCGSRQIGRTAGALPN